MAPPRRGGPSRRRRQPRPRLARRRREAPILVRGSGARVWDADGRSYVDLVGSFGPHLLGHAHPGISRAVRAALAVGDRSARRIPPRSASRSASARPCPPWHSSASPARYRSCHERAARGPRGHRSPARPRSSRAAITDMPTPCWRALARAWRRTGCRTCAGVDAAVTAGTLVLPFNDADAVVAAFRSRRRRIAAVIVEPVAANMGVIPPEPGFLDGLRDVTRRDGALLIFDEVITALPRRARRRPGALRHRPGPDAPGQGHRGRHAHRRLRWTGRPHGHRWPRLVPSTRPARWPATRSRWQPARPC